MPRLQMDFSSRGNCLRFYTRNNVPKLQLWKYMENSRPMSKIRTSKVKPDALKLLLESGERCEICAGEGDPDLTRPKYKIRSKNKNDKK